MTVSHRLRRWTPAITFALLSLVVTISRLFGGDWVFGHDGADVSLQFLSWREFGFSELRHGNLALWNPYIFGGVPYFAGFQSALLYPSNWIHLFLTPATAVNWTVAIHLFLAGMLMYRWCKHAGSSQTAATFAGICWMFCGPFYLRLYAGHLSILCLIPWVPLLWEAIDRAFIKPNLSALLMGTFALSMMILAGHPQYVYFAGIVTSVYVAMKLIDRATWSTRLRAVAICVGIVIGGISISAVQLLTALDANKEFVRSAGLDYQTAASFSLPPENLLTLFAPGVFGSLPLSVAREVPPGYFGRAYLWEMSLFMSVCGTILAVVGLLRSIARRQTNWIILLTMSLVLSLGAHTPVHRILFDYLPGFGDFRGVSKFSFLLLMILCRLSADGWDGLRDQTGRRLGIGIAATCAIALAILAIIASRGSDAGKSSFWAHFLRDHLEAASDAQENYIEPTLLAKPEFFNAAAAVSSKSLFAASLTSIGVLGCIIASRWQSKARCGLLVIGVIELLTFAFQNRALSSAHRPIPEHWQQTIASLPKDARILTPQPGLEDWSMSWRIPNAWGYDPNVQLRYTQLVSASQGVSPDHAKNYLNFRGMNPSFQRLLRIGAILFVDEKKPSIQANNPLPVASLVPVPFLIPKRDDLLRQVLSEQFDPAISIALETKPGIQLESSFDPGQVKVLDSSTDWIEIQANVKAATMLLITNSYSQHWKVRPIASPQTEFEVMPADWAFIGIPLKPGAHHLRIEYAPTSFTVGAWITVLSTGAFFALFVWQFSSRFRARSSDN